MEAGIYLLLVGSTIADAVRDDTTTEVFASDAGELHVFPSTTSTPGWAHDLALLWPDIRQLDLSSARAGCVIALDVKNRTFLISFGSGHLKIDRRHVVHDFGRRAALNAVQPDTIRQVSRQALEGNFIHAIEQAAKSGSVHQFGIDIERDLLQGIFGKTRKKAFGNGIGGATSLRVSIDGSIETIIARLPIFLRLYRQKIRASDFLWYERIQLIQDATTISQLNGELNAEILAGGADILLGLPKVMESSDQIVAFRFEQATARRPPARYSDPELTDWIAWRQQSGKVADLAAAEAKDLYVDFESGASFRAPIADSLLWEHVNPATGVVHVRNDGGWYRIDPAFVLDVNTYLQRVAASGLALPNYIGGTERAYNLQLTAAVPGSHLLDGQNVTLPGAKNAIEPCDVYWFDAVARRGRLFFVKRKRVGSSGLTHLFTQVLVGVDAFFHRDQAMRVAIANRLTPQGANLGFRTTTVPQGRHWQACIVICQQRNRNELPFLCKISLKRIAESLTARYGVAITLDIV